MRLFINESDLARFKRRAARGYPREVYGILLGKRLANRTFKILRIIIPPIVEATYDYVIPDYDKIEEIVSSSDLDYIGSIHSHPQAPPTISTHDYQYWDKDRRSAGQVQDVQAGRERTQPVKLRWRTPRNSL